MLRLVILAIIAHAVCAQYSVGESCIDSLGRLGYVRRGRDVLPLGLLEGNVFLRQELLCATDCSLLGREGDLCVGGISNGGVSNATNSRTWPTPFGNCRNNQCINVECSAQTSLGSACNEAGGINVGFCGLFDPRALGTLDPEPGLLDMTQFHAQTCVRGCAPGTASGFPPQDAGCENGENRGSLCSLISDAPSGSEDFLPANSFVQHACQEIQSANLLAASPSDVQSACPGFEVVECQDSISLDSEGNCVIHYRNVGQLCYISGNNEAGICLPTGTISGVQTTSCIARAAERFADGFGDVFENPAYTLKSSDLTNLPAGLPDQTGLPISTCGLLDTIRPDTPPDPLPCITLNQDGQTAIGVCTVGSQQVDRDWVCEIVEQCQDGFQGPCNVGDFFGYCIEYQTQLLDRMGPTNTLVQNGTCAVQCATDYECRYDVLNNYPVPPFECEIAGSTCNTVDSFGLMNNLLASRRTQNLTACEFFPKDDTLCSSRDPTCGNWSCNVCSGFQDESGCCLISAAAQGTNCNLPNGDFGVCTGGGLCASLNDGCFEDDNCRGGAPCTKGHCNNGSCVYLPRNQNVCSQQNRMELSRQCRELVCNPMDDSADSNGCVSNIITQNEGKSCQLDSRFVYFSRAGEGTGVCQGGSCVPAPVATPVPIPAPGPGSPAPGPGNPAPGPGSPAPGPGSPAPPPVIPPRPRPGTTSSYSTSDLPRQQSVGFSESEFPLDIQNKWNFIDGFRVQRPVRGSPSDFDSDTADDLSLSSLKSFDSRVIDEPWMFANAHQLEGVDVPTQRFDVQLLTDDDDDDDAILNNIRTQDGVFDCGVASLTDFQHLALPSCGGPDDAVGALLTGHFFSETDDDDKTGCTPTCYCRLLTFQNRFFSSPVACTRGYWPHGNTPDKLAPFIVGLVLITIGFGAIVVQATGHAFKGIFYNTVFMQQEEEIMDSNLLQKILSYVKPLALRDV